MASLLHQVHHTYTLRDNGHFILYGDNIIQQSSRPYNTFAFGAALADIYARKLDIINRGLWGYDTLQALRALSLSLPDPEKTQVKFLLLMFGANDTQIPNSHGGPDQSVGVEDFQRNLRHMVCDPSVKAHGEDVHIILVTTPPVDERKCLESDQEEYPNLGQTLRRTAANTALYAQAVRDL
ncbi:isoamyl acetate-hydrolyzing esterase, partial [Elasticomyces elasticus]